jgi:hypothetical protein
MVAAREAEFRIRVIEGQNWSKDQAKELARLDKSSPLAHPFQTEPFVALFNTDPDRPPYAVLAEDGSGLAAYWRGYFARYNDGFIPRCNAWLRSGPVVREDLADERQRIFSVMLAEAKRHLVSQGVGRGILTSEALYSDSCDRHCLMQGFTRYDLQTYLVDLTSSEEDLWKKLGQRPRRSVNTGRKNGVTIEEAVSLDDLRDYYQLFLEAGSVPGSGVPTTEQFVERFPRLREEGKARVIFARYQGKVVAGSFFPCYRGFAAQHQISVSAEGRKLNAGALLLWESMLRFKNEGCHALDQISVEVSPAAGSRQAGVRDFKSQWGGALIETPVYLYLSPALRLWKAISGGIKGLRAPRDARG